MSKKYIYLIFRVIIKEYDNGDKYDGEWKNGKKEGKGIFYYNNGDKYEGIWNNDEYVRNCYLF